MEFDSFITTNIDLYMGKPKSGKTLIAGSYPKPMLYVSVGDDGGGRVLLMRYREDINNGLIKVKNLKNDQPVNGKILNTSLDKLCKLLADLRKEPTQEFKTIVIDTLGALQDDYRAYMEYSKGGRSLSQQEWGDISKRMLDAKDNMKRFSEEYGTQFVWICHTREQEVYETSGLDKEIRMVPDLTISTGNKYLKDASNIFYCCRKNVLQPDGSKIVKFLTFVGPHPAIDTGTRDILLENGEFVENFSYDKWLSIVESGALTGVQVATADKEEDDQQED